MYRVSLEKYIAKQIKKFDKKTSFEGRGIFDLRPYYLDPENLAEVGSILFERIRHLDNFQIGGVENSSLPLITCLLLRCQQAGKNVNGFYIRKSRKKHGLYKKIEGDLNQNPVILVDDVLNSGHTMLWAEAVLSENKLSVKGILSLLQFQPNEHYDFLLNKETILASVVHLSDLNIEVTPHAVTHNPYRTKWLNKPKTATYNIVAPKSLPAIKTGRVFYGMDIGVFGCFDLETGKKLWQVKTGLHAAQKNIFSSPKTHKDMVYFGSYDGKFYALKQETGEPKWTFEECDWIGSSPDIAPELNLVFIGLEHSGPINRRGSVVALETSEGSKIWEFDMQAFTHASPLYIKETSQVAIGSNEGVLYLLDAKTGKLIWKFKTEGGQNYISGGFSPGDIKHRPAYDKETDTIAFCSVDGYMYVLRRSDGQMVFRNQGVKSAPDIYIGSFSSPVFHGRFLLYAAADKFLYCLDKKTGELIWKFNARCRIFSSPVIHEDRVFIGTNMGRLYEFDIKNGNTLTVNQFPERLNNPIVIHKDHLLVTTNDNCLYNLEFKNS